MLAQRVHCSCYRLRLEKVRTIKKDPHGNGVRMAGLSNEGKTGTCCLAYWDANIPWSIIVDLTVLPL
jgi:hypothetical protein